MTEWQIIALAASIVLAAFSGLAGLIVSMVKHNWTRMEVGLENERKARAEEMKGEREMWLRMFTEQRKDVESAMDKERAGRTQDRHDAADDLSLVAGKQAAFELYCAREYVSYPRLTQALEPMNANLQRIFEKLDGKQDKPRVQGA